MSVDYDFYSVNFGGKMSESVISPYLIKAGDILISSVCCEDISGTQTDEFKRAVCIQAEYMAEGRGGDFSAKLGDFSVSGNDSGGKIICNEAMAILINNGMFFRGGVTI